MWKYPNASIISVRTRSMRPSYRSASGSGSISEIVAVALWNVAQSHHTAKFRIEIVLVALEAKKPGEDD